MKVEISKPAQESLAYIINENKTIGQKILSQLKYRLPLDPYPDIKNENDIFQAELIRGLKKLSFDIYRLKSLEFKEYRVFYIVDENSNSVYILEIIKRDENTYKMSAKHIETIKTLYIQYYTNKTICKPTGK